MIILRISCHPFQRGGLTIALAHHAQLQGEGLHTGRFFAIAHPYRARRNIGTARAMHLGRAATAVAACIARRSAVQTFTHRRSG